MRNNHNAITPSSIIGLLFCTDNIALHCITEDLWEHLEKGSGGKPVKSVMDTWTKKMGYPVLTVSSEKTANQTVLKVAQKKFNADGSPGKQTQYTISICHFTCLTSRV